MHQGCHGTVRTVLLLQMSFQPAMGIGRVDHVELTPCQRRARQRGGILGIGLHAADIASLDNIMLGVFTGLAGQGRTGQAGCKGDGRELHRC